MLWGVVAVVIVIVVAIFASGDKRMKLWAKRPEVLRALAARRGYRVVNNPGKPSELVPIRPLEKARDFNAFELPVAVTGRTLDSDLTLFDVYTETQPKFSKNRSRIRKFETYITIKSGQDWPHFELVSMPVANNSFTGKLLEMTSGVAEIVMSERGLTRVPTPDHPGFQLYVADASDGPRVRDALLPIVSNRGAWWLGALGDALALQRSDTATAIGSGSLVNEKELDRFVDEALEIERAASGAIRKENA